MGMGRRLLLATVSIAVCLVLVSPLVTGTDDFPVSTQPMFAVPRGQFAEFVTARGFDDEGEVVDLSLAEIGGTDDPLIAEALLRAARSSGTLDRVCDRILARSDRNLAAVEVVSVTHDLDVARDEPPAALDVLHRCVAR